MPSTATIPNFQGKKKLHTHTQTHIGDLAWCSSLKPMNGFCTPLPLQVIPTCEKVLGLRRLNPKVKRFCLDSEF